ncbi:MAG: hypothetical protein MSIBF_02550, partial [Candidatus Altiarchaeales archaeon IMC4]
MVYVIYQNRITYIFTYILRKMIKTNQEISKLMKVMQSMEDFDMVEFVLLHGSSAEGRATENSDIDVCVYFKGNSEEQSRFRLRLLEKLPSDIDVQIFQQLPLYVRKEVLKGREIYVHDREFTYDLALQN